MPQTKKTQQAQQAQQAQQTDKGKKRPRGRPVSQKKAEPIPDTPENIARAILNTPPKKAHEWEYMKKK